MTCRHTIFPPRSDRGSFLPLPDHRDTSLISWHCHSMTIARRMSARASTAAALRAYCTKHNKRLPRVHHESAMRRQKAVFLLSAGKNRQFSKNLTLSPMHQTLPSVHRLTFFDRFHDLQCIDALRRHIQRIFTENDHIRQLSWCQRSFNRFLKILICTVTCYSLKRI